jgi:hypothetical protein
MEYALRMSFVIVLPYNDHLLHHFIKNYLKMNVIIKEISIEDAPAINHLSYQLGYSINLEDTKTKSKRF